MIILFRTIQECIDECTDYQTGNWDLLAVKESILSACDQEYCVIYRNNVNNIDSLYGLYSPEDELMFVHKTREGACKNRDEYEKIHGFGFYVEVVTVME